MKIVQVLADAADSVAAHFSLAAVRVEHTHFRVRKNARADQYNAVPADSVMDIDVVDGDGFGTGDLSVAVVEIDIIVSAGLHLRKGQL